ncbi:hypothetical protein D9M69_642160 [compost metagenome]
MFVQAPDQIGRFEQREIAFDGGAHHAQFFAHLGQVALSPRVLEQAKVEAAQHLGLAEFGRDQQVFKDHPLYLVLIEVFLLGEQGRQAPDFGETTFEEEGLDVLVGHSPPPVFYIFEYLGNAFRISALNHVPKKPKH